MTDCLKAIKLKYDFSNISVQSIRDNDESNCVRVADWVNDILYPVKHKKPSTPGCSKKCETKDKKSLDKDE